MNSARQWITMVAGLEVQHLCWSLVAGNLRLTYFFKKSLDIEGVSNPMASVKFWTKPMGDLNELEEGLPDVYLSWKLKKLSRVDIERETTGITVILCYEIAMSEVEIEETKKMAKLFGQKVKINKINPLTYSFADTCSANQIERVVLAE